MKRLLGERDIDELFKISLYLKAFNASWELALGFLLLFTDKIENFCLKVINKELIEDRQDIIAKSIKHAMPYIMHHNGFASFYLISHSIVNLFLAIALLKNKLWAYPVAIVFFSLFVIYQIYRFTHTHSILLLLLTLLDMVIIWLTWHEYKKRIHRIHKI